MRAIIIGLTFLMISAVYMLEVSMAQAHSLTIYDITYLDEDDRVIHKDYFAVGSDLSDYVLPQAPEREGYVFIGWSFEVPDEMPDSDIVVHAQYVRNVLVIHNSI